MQRRASSDVSGVRLAEVLSGLSYALDLTEGQREGHAARTCLIGMRLADVLQLPDNDRAALFYALLLKDLGSSSNAARFAALFAADDRDLKQRLKTIDWSRASESFQFVTRSVAPGAFWLKRAWQMFAVFARGPEGAREVVRTRCERGAEIASTIGFTPKTADAIRTIDEHWDGHGQPRSLRRDYIPLLGRIVGLAQMFEVFLTECNRTAAFDMARARSGRWFDPELVAALSSLEGDDAFWHRVVSEPPMAQLAGLEPESRVAVADERRLDSVAAAFAQVIDAKSPWTYKHSAGVADIAESVAALIGMTPRAIRELRRAALLHDLGKLTVSNLILDKPGELDDRELAIVRAHPSYTHGILARVGCLRSVAGIAAAHHERLDGAGYHLGLGGRALPVGARVLAAADICDALRSSRPYRPGLSNDRVLEIMGREVGRGIDAECFEAIRHLLRHDVAGAAGDAPAIALVPALSEDYGQAA